MNINDLRKLCFDETIQITDHCFHKMLERGISYEEIKICILHGEIIEDYPNDYPYPSALVMECSVGKPVHVVAGLSDDLLWIITAYYPDPHKWESDHKTRKEKKA